MLQNLIKFTLTIHTSAVINYHFYAQDMTINTFSLCNEPSNYLVLE